MMWRFVSRAAAVYRRELRRHAEVRTTRIMQSCWWTHAPQKKLLRPPGRNPGLVDAQDPQHRLENRRRRGARRPPSCLGRWRSTVGGPPRGNGTGQENEPPVRKRMAEPVLETILGQRFIIRHEEVLHSARVQIGEDIMKKRFSEELHWLVTK